MQSFTAPNPLPEGNQRIRIRDLIKCTFIQHSVRALPTNTIIQDFLHEDKALLGGTFIWELELKTADKHAGFRQGRGTRDQINESQNTYAQGTQAPTTTVYVICGLQEGVQLSPMISSG